MRPLGIISALMFAFLPAIASAHEVYVLTPDEIHLGITTPHFLILPVIMANLPQFLLFAGLGILVVSVVFVTSLSGRFEKLLQPFFMRAKHFAPFIARVTAGLAFLACAYFGALFGPELPLHAVFGPYASVARLALAFTGLLILAGLWVRVAALVAATLFAVAISRYGLYMITYTNYVGEVIVLLLIGAHRVSLERLRGHGFGWGARFFKQVSDRWGKYSLLILRIAFGTSLIFASVYAKFLHNYLALQVASLPLAGHAQELAHYFGLEPHFMVVGAGIVEILIGLFFIVGFEIRFTALFLEFWLALSLWYFGEVVWPHLILVGVPIAFLLYGYDRYSLEGRFFKHGNREPIL